MNATIVSVGDELVSGQTVNTNATWLSAQLAELGIVTSAHVTVGDALELIVPAIQQAAATSDVVLISGGLGPTEDDLTREAVAAALGEDLVADEEARKHLEAFFRRIKRPMTESNVKQAMRPKSAGCLENPQGTAPGLRTRIGKAEVFVMPGVPREMKAMFQTSIAPALGRHAGDQVVRVAKISTFGLGESLVGEKIKDLMVRGGNPAVGTTVHDGIVSVRIYARGTAVAAAEMIASMSQTVRDRLGPIIFGEGDETLDSVVGRMLLEQKRTIATAESCTAGLLANMLTEAPGASAYFMRGWVTYSNQAKADELEISGELIGRHGAVSAEVATAMAEGACRLAGTEMGVGITGIAGPTGGTVEKPVGLVYIALAGSRRTVVKRTIFPGSRAQVRLRAAQMALSMIRWELMGVDLGVIFSEG